jgi:hypothetical protein
MPAKKPIALIAKHLTKAEQSARTERESEITPITLLSAEIPDSLKGGEYKHAAKVWIRSINLYAELKGVIATSLDENLLVKYCKAEQQFVELEGFRSEKIQEWEGFKNRAKKINLTSEENQIKEWRRMWSVINEMEKIVTVFDARLDAKGKYIHSLEQSLYLTPRSRSGVAPTEKEKAKGDIFGDEFG